MMRERFQHLDLAGEAQRYRPRWFGRQFQQMLKSKIVEAFVGFPYHLENRTPFEL
jgi:hypothetical protein